MIGKQKNQVQWISILIDIFFQIFFEHQLRQNNDLLNRDRVRTEFTFEKGKTYTFSACPRAMSTHIPSHRATRLYSSRMEDAVLC